MPPELWDKDPEYSDEVSEFPELARHAASQTELSASRLTCGHLAARYMNVLLESHRMLIYENHNNYELV